MSDHRHIAVSTALVSAVNLLGKVLGFAKTMAIAWAFGASSLVDAFLVAYMLPTVLPTVLKGMLTAAFIPRFMRSLSGSRTHEAWRGANSLFTLLCGLFAGLTIALIVFADPLVTILAPGLADHSHDMATALTRTMALGAFFLGLNAILTAIAYARQRFGFAALEGVVTNSVIIAGILLFSGKFGVEALAVSVVVGFAAQTVVLTAANWRLVRDVVRPAIDWAHEDFRAPLRHMVPLTVGAIGAVVIGVINQVFASYLDAGSIAVLGYATMLALIPMEIFGQAIRTTFYPTLSRHHAEGDVAALRETHIRGLRLYVLVMLPAIALLIIFAEPAVAVVFERGSFSADMTRQTAAVVIAVAVGLLSRGVAWFNFGVFHSLVQPWIPVTLGLLEVILNAVLAWLLVKPFGVVGIALATSIAHTVSMIVTLVLLTRRLGTNIVQPMLEPCLKIGVMTAALVLTAKLAAYLGVAALQPQGRFWESAWMLAGVLPAGVAFLAVGAFLQLAEVRGMLAVIREKWIMRVGRLSGS